MENSKLIGQTIVGDTVRKILKLPPKGMVPGTFDINPAQFPQYEVRHSTCMTYNENQ